MVPRPLQKLGGDSSVVSTPCPFCLRLGGRTLAPSILASYMQRQKKQASRQAKKQMEGKAC